MDIKKAIDWKGKRMDINKEIDWEQWRCEIAKDVCSRTVSITEEEAVWNADALTKELKKTSK